MASPNSVAILADGAAEGEQPDVSIPQQSFPRSRAAAKAALPWYKQAALDAFGDYVRARRKLERCRGELAIVRDIASGHFAPDERVSITESGRAALS